jgi:hypothetical protein
LSILFRKDGAEFRDGTKAVAPEFVFRDEDSLGFLLILREFLNESSEQRHIGNRCGSN